ncbi:hypothetical protein F2P81_001672 [Scophthalmus maximus]|uniref:Uncharacterized protein n=1 Tax=Scophthalmus maximus TaxID=52904 RepID=A0A6A4TGS5_SCOMX|nr:hypothetical protein F2P81_001672 [Scophthalmus maximus]
MSADKQSSQGMTKLKNDGLLKETFFQLLADELDGVTGSKVIVSVKKLDVMVWFLTTQQQQTLDQQQHKRITPPPPRAISVSDVEDFRRVTPLISDRTADKIEANDPSNNLFRKYVSTSFASLADRSDFLPYETLQ